MRLCKGAKTHQNSSGRNRSHHISHEISAETHQPRVRIGRYLLIKKNVGKYKTCIRFKNIDI